MRHEAMRHEAMRYSDDQSVMEHQLEDGIVRTVINSEMALLHGVNALILQILVINYCDSLRRNSQVVFEHAADRIQRQIALLTKEDKFKYVIQIRNIFAKFCRISMMGTHCKSSIYAVITVLRF